MPDKELTDFEFTFEGSIYLAQFYMESMSKGDVYYVLITDPKIAEFVGHHLLYLREQKIDGIWEYGVRNYQERIRERNLRSVLMNTLIATYG